MSDAMSVWAEAAKAVWTPGQPLEWQAKMQFTMRDAMRVASIVSAYDDVFEVALDAVQRSFESLEDAIALAKATPGFPAGQMVFERDDALLVWALLFEAEMPSLELADIAKAAIDKGIEEAREA